MARGIFMGFLLLVFASALQADPSEQKELDFSKAWYQPELIENNDAACSSLLKDARDKFFGNSTFDAAYRVEGHGHPQAGAILNWEIIAGAEPAQVEAYGKTFYLNYLNHSGCQGYCETNQPLVSDKPIVVNAEMAEGAPPAISYEYTVARNQSKDVYLFMLGTVEAFKAKLLVYRLAPDARWLPACKMELAPKDLHQIKDPDIESAIESLIVLNKAVDPLDQSGGKCGTIGAGGWKSSVTDGFDQVLYRPWSLPIHKLGLSENSYGDYERIGRQLEWWSLTGVLEYRKFESYKMQLDKSTGEISAFYRKKFGWSEVQSKVMAEDALTAAVSRGFGFYLYHPRFADGEEELRKAILQKKDIDRVKAIQFEQEDIDATYMHEPEFKESILNIAVEYPEALEYLLQRGFDPNVANDFGKTPLMYAAQFNQIESARILIKNGANPSAQTIKPPNECYYSLQTFRMTPLHYAVRYASPAFIRLLLDAKASVSARAENHRDFRFVEETPLDWLRKYTVAGTSERNPNIHDHEIPEVEEWLQLPKVE